MELDLVKFNSKPATIQLPANDTTIKQNTLIYSIVSKRYLNCIVTPKERIRQKLSLEQSEIIENLLEF